MKTEDKNKQATAGSEFEQAIAAVQTAEQEAAGIITLDPVAKRSVVRVRKGSEKLIMQMILAAQAFPQYVPAGINPQGMQEDLATLDQIRQLRTVITAFLGSVEDTDLKATGDLWLQALDIYAALSRKTASDGKVGDYLAGMKSFLARAPKPEAAGDAAVPAAAAANAAGAAQPAAVGAATKAR